MGGGGRVDSVGSFSDHEQGEWIITAISMGLQQIELKALQRDQLSTSKKPAKIRWKYAFIIDSQATRLQIYSRIWIGRSQQSIDREWSDPGNIYALLFAEISTLRIPRSLSKYRHKLSFFSGQSTTIAFQPCPDDCIAYAKALPGVTPWLSITAEVSMLFLPCKTSLF